MQKKFHFWYRLFGFTKDQGFLRNQTSCNSTNKEVCKARTEVSFWNRFSKNFAYFWPRNIYYKSTGYFEEKKLYIIVAQDFKTFSSREIFCLILFFCFSRNMKNWTQNSNWQYFHIKFWLQILRMRRKQKRVFRLCYLEHDQKSHNTQTILLKIANLLFCSLNAW